MEKIFYLKTVVIARALAEVVALLVMTLLPISYFFIEQVRHLPLPFQLAGATAAVIAFILAALYTQIIWQIKISTETITLRSLCKTQQIKWPAITRLRLQSTWRSPEYVLITQSGEVHFPAKFNHQDELAASIRKHLPNEGRSNSEVNVFTQSTFSIFIEFVKALFLLAMVVCAWSFYHDVGLSPKVVPGDSLLILVACILGTVIVLSRIIAIFFMPWQVYISKREVQIKCLARQRTLAKKDLLKLSTPLFLLPVGVVLKSTQGSFLITDRLSGYDELRDELEHRCSGKTHS